MGSNPDGRMRFSLLHTSRLALGYSGRGVALTTHHALAKRLRIGPAIVLHPRCACTACYRVNLAYTRCRLSLISCKTSLRITSLMMIGYFDRKQVWLLLILVNKDTLCLCCCLNIELNGLSVKTSKTDIFFSLVSFLNMRDQFSSPYQTTGKIVVVYSNLHVLDCKWQDRAFVYLSLLRVQIAGTKHRGYMKRLATGTAQLQAALSFLVNVIPVPQ